MFWSCSCGVVVVVVAAAAVAMVDSEASSFLSRLVVAG